MVGEDVGCLKREFGRAAGWQRAGKWGFFDTEDGENKVVRDGGGVAKKGSVELAQDRTGDLLLRRETRYPLRYKPVAGTNGG